MQPASYLKALKTTVIVNGRMALRTSRLQAARDSSMALMVSTVEQAAARLAGGFLQIVDHVTLRELVSQVLPDTDVGELEPIKSLPGMPSAFASTLMKFWLSDIRDDEFGVSPRIAAIRKLEAAVMEVLPSHLMRPADLVALACSRAAHAPMIFGEVRFRGMTDLHPVWRPFLDVIASGQKVVWEAGPRQLPELLKERPSVGIVFDEPSSPDVLGVSCASDRHEVIEAIRWVRSRIVAGIDPADIAIATVSLQTYDDLVAAVAGETDVAVHMTSGAPALTTRAGQTTAALADLMLRGISQKRVVRLFSLIGPGNGVLAELPGDWDAALPTDAALTNVKRWRKALERRPSTVPVADIVVPILQLVAKGASVAADLGKAVLPPEPLAIWERALKDGPASAMDRTLRAIKVDDDINPLSNACYMSAEDLAASPRSHVWLFGLTSRNWPRRQTEDALIPRHVVPSERLDPMPLSRIDAVDFETITRTTGGTLFLSWPRRDGDGRQLGVSGLVPQEARTGEGMVYLSRSRETATALSETDRMFSRPAEFAKTKEAAAVTATIRDWLSPLPTAHDGLVSAKHPRIEAILRQVQSATSLRKLLRDPLSFVWRYALGFKAPEYEDEPLLLDARQFGNIVHEVLRRSVENLERSGGFAKADPSKLFEAIADARLDVGGIVETTQPVPPALVWIATMDLAEKFAKDALQYPLPYQEDARSFAEIPFGRPAKWIREDVPWEQDREVRIPGTDIRVGGIMDRLDVLKNGRKAYPVDYKSGNTPEGVEKFVLNGGKELQRPIYRYMVKAVLGEEVEVESALLYPFTGTYAPLPDTGEAIDLLAQYVAVARDLLLEGSIVAGIDAEDAFSDTKFALPSQADAVYLARKEGARYSTLTGLADLWSEE
jgi:hypothetical protein